MKIEVYFADLDFEEVYERPSYGVIYLLHTNPSLSGFIIIYHLLYNILGSSSFLLQVFQFFSDIGGSLGLWMGFSLMTTFEFLELAVDLLVYGCLRLSGRGAGTGLNDSPRRGPLHRRFRRKAFPPREEPIQSEHRFVALKIITKTLNKIIHNIQHYWLLFFIKYLLCSPVSGTDIELEDLQTAAVYSYPFSPPPPYASPTITPVDA